MLPSTVFLSTHFITLTSFKFRLSQNASLSWDPGANSNLIFWSHSVAACCLWQDILTGHNLQYALLLLLYSNICRLWKYQVHIDWNCSIISTKENENVGSYLGLDLWRMMMASGGLSSFGCCKFDSFRMARRKLLKKLVSRLKPIPIRSCYLTQDWSKAAHWRKVLGRSLLIQGTGKKTSHYSRADKIWLEGCQFEVFKDLGKNYGNRMASAW